MDKILKSNLKNYVLIFLLVAIVAVAAFTAGGWWYAGPDLPMKQVGNFFLDVNNDGLPDYVFQAEVILNPDTNPLSVQSTTK